MRSYNLFLDDFRSPREAFNITGDFDYNKLEWVSVRSYEEFVDYITLRSNEGIFPRLISFDHDLADAHYDYTDDEMIPYQQFSEKTGLECAKWLTEFCLEAKIELPEYKVHSANPVGKKNIIGYLENFKKHNPHNDLNVGDLVLVRPSFIGNPPDMLGFVYESYQNQNGDRSKNGVSIILSNGSDIGGFSYREQKDYLSFVKPSGIDYTFTNFNKLNEDFHRVIKPVFK